MPEKLSRRFCVCELYSLMISAFSLALCILTSFADWFHQNVVTFHEICYSQSIHPSICNCLSRAGSWGQESEQRAPDTSTSSQHSQESQETWCFQHVLGLPQIIASQSDESVFSGPSQRQQNSLKYNEFNKVSTTTKALLYK